MRVQNLRGSILADERLMLTWELMEEPRAILVQIGQDSEFTKVRRTFMLPAVTAVALDCGPGRWWYRAGAVVGGAADGVVDWSGTYGPAVIVAKKAVVPVAPARLKIRSTEHILEGIRVRTGLREPYYVFVDVSMDKDFRAGAIETRYVRDHGEGFVDVEGLKEGETYHLRLTTVAGDWTGLGAAGRIESFCEGLELSDVRRGKSPAAIVTAAAKGSVDAVTRQNLGYDRVVADANRVLLREARDKPVQRFSSHADYLRFVQAQRMNVVGR
jgi:hypothetical protein